MHGILIIQVTPYVFIAQKGPITLFSYDIPSATLTHRYPIDLLGPSSSSIIPGTDLIATFGYRDYNLIEDRGDYFVHGDAHIALTNINDGTSAIQNLGVTGTITSTNIFEDIPLYASFTEKGLLEFEGQHYEYRADGYYPVSPTEPDVDVSDFTYFRGKTGEVVSRAARMVNAPSSEVDSPEPFQNGIQIYAGNTCDYVVVNTIEKSAFYTTLPNCGPCYDFTYWDPDAPDPETGDFTGVAYTTNSCDLKTGEAQVTEEDMYFSYETDVYGTSLP